MFRNVIVGVDISDGSYDAAALAVALAPDTGPRVDLVSAYPDPLLPFPLVLRSDEHADTDVWRRLEEVGEASAPDANAHAIADNSPARALRHRAEREHATLIVLGSQRRAEPGRCSAGHTARQVIHGAPCAVAIASAGLHAAPVALDRIVVGVDGSPEGDAALAVAATLARERGARLELVAVVDDRVPVVLAPTAIPAELTRWSDMIGVERSRAQQLVDRLRGEHPGTEGEVRVGDPVEQLADAARDADLLVLGSRHWGPLARVLVGSIGEDLLHDAPCSLLLVPRPASAA